MDLAIQVAIGSSIQIALFVTPFLVIMGWILSQPLTLDFPIPLVGILFVSVFVVNCLIVDGKSTWLEGWVLLASYVIVAVAVLYVNV